MTIRSLKELREAIRKTSCGPNCKRNVSELVQEVENYWWGQYKKKRSLPLNTDSKKFSISLEESGIIREMLEGAYEPKPVRIINHGFGFYTLTNMTNEELKKRRKRIGG